MIGKHGVAFYLYKQVCAKKGGEGGGRTERSMYTNFHGKLGGGGVEVCLERRGVGQDFGYQSDLCLEVAIHSKN